MEAAILAVVGNRNRYSDHSGKGSDCNKIDGIMAGILQTHNFSGWIQTKPPKK